MAVVYGEAIINWRLGRWRPFLSCFFQFQNKESNNKKGWKKGNDSWIASGGVLLIFCCKWVTPKHQLNLLMDKRRCWWRLGNIYRLNEEWWIDMLWIWYLIWVLDIFLLSFCGRDYWLWKEEKKCDFLCCSLVTDYV